MPVDVTQIEGGTEALIRLYEQTERRLTALLADLVKQQAERRRIELVLQQLDSLVRGLHEGQHRWSRAWLPRAYRWGWDLTGREMRLPVLPAMTLLDRQAIETAIARTLSDTAEALESVAPQARRVWIDTRQALVSNQRMARLVAEGLVEGVSPEEFRRRVVATLQDAASERLQGLVPDHLRADLEAAARGEWIRVGRRRYRLRTYGELVARTAPRFAATEGALRRAEQAGTDLVQMSVHSRACPRCQVLQGRLYSLRGQTEGFPVLQNEHRPPVHPNCRHVLVGVDVGALAERGQLEPLRRLSGSNRPIASYRDWREALAA